VPITFAGLAVTLPESLRSRSSESSVTFPESPVTFDRNTHCHLNRFGQYDLQDREPDPLDYGIRFSTGTG